MAALIISIVDQEPRAMDAVAAIISTVVMAHRLPREQHSLFGRYFSGSTVVLEEPSGADCMPGGVWPCGLSAGAPPVPVWIGPVQPCGCFSPFVSGTTVRPVLQRDLSVSPGRYPGLTGSLLT